MKKVSIDFGTTNTVVAVWRESLNGPETLYLPGLSAPAEDDLPPLIPTLLYVKQGDTESVVALGSFIIGSCRRTSFCSYLSI